MINRLDDLKDQYRDMQVNLAIRGLNNGYLKPDLWEDLRIKLQSIYRNATGEEFAVLIVDGD